MQSGNPSLGMKVFNPSLNLNPSPARDVVPPPVLPKKQRRDVRVLQWLLAVPLHPRSPGGEGVGGPKVGRDNPRLQLRRGEELLGNVGCWREARLGVPVPHVDEQLQQRGQGAHSLSHSYSLSVRKVVGEVNGSRGKRAGVSGPGLQRSRTTHCSHSTADPNQPQRPWTSVNKCGQV